MPFDVMGVPLSLGVNGMATRQCMAPHPANCARAAPAALALPRRCAPTTLGFNYFENLLEITDTTGFAAVLPLH
ncbi:hypothetical protein, partial [Polaromonas sp. A23]|uniref:hypothetical protein n=1 Tax=Polaromonas sp. A23 TaxID=1944133 RepID=UPI001C2BB2B3